VRPVDRRVRVPIARVGRVAQEIRLGHQLEAGLPYFLAHELLVARF
jgi:hypothetical protein